MHWLHALDIGLFRFVNRTLSNSVLDVLMPFVSGQGSKGFFLLAAVAAAVAVLWRGNARARLCVLMLALILWPGDSLVCNTLKHAIARARPPGVLEGVRLPGRQERNYTSADAAMGDRVLIAERGAVKLSYTSFPSSHSANWFAAAMILLIYYRRSGWVMVPLASLVAVSRIYMGVHYPSDVLAGAVLGAGYAAAGVWLLNRLWQGIGKMWFPLWWEKLPSLVYAEQGMRSVELENPDAVQSAIGQHWLRLGYLVIAAVLLARLAYLRSGSIELSGDEAYQWLWSKHLALSYYSKPPLIAYTQWLGTHLFGDTEFGVRCFAPVIAAALSWLVLRFFAREVNARAGFFLVLILAATPLMAVGTTLMTVDPLSVLFWTAAMLAGWRAAQPDGKTSDWLWTGLWMGLGFLSKYTELFQWLCWAVFFALWKPARIHLRKPGPYLALLVNLICATPVLLWNAQHHWSTVTHVANDAGAGQPWHFTFRFFNDFMASEAFLLNPVFFLAALWAAIALWRQPVRDARLVYFFSMGAPLFLVYFLFTLHSRVLPNWIAPSVLPLFCAMVIYWDARWRSDKPGVGKCLMSAGVVFGVVFAVFLSETDLVQKIAGRPLPPKPDPLTRVRAYAGVARLVGDAREKLLAEGKPVFLIAGHYQLVGEISFYLPEAKTNVAENPLVYFPSTDQPVNQFFFWPGYDGQRVGQNAIYFNEIGGPPLVRGWFFKWLGGETNLLRYEPKPEPAPPQLLREFDSVTDLGLRDVLYRDRIFHTIQLFECRHLK